MEFALAIVFLFVYYIRPQDWMAGLEGLNIIQPIMGIWLVSLFAFRSRTSPLRGILRTPHDWAILLYMAYIILFASGGFVAVISLFSFYFLTVQSVNSWSRVLSYLRFWNWALVIVSAIAVAFVFGIDITGAKDVWVNRLGRLAIGTWLHNNPNALAHSLVVIIPLSYILYFWKGTKMGQFFLFPLMAGLAFYAAWETKSKGAYVVGGLSVAMLFMIGRSIKVKAFVIALVLLMGSTLISFMPRMSDMDDLRSDEGVQGRLLAWEQAREVSKNDPIGVGWKKFIAYIPWQEGNKFEIIPKSTHSSYVQVAADLGWVGLLLYLSGFWTCSRTLAFAKYDDVEKERIRRALLILLTSTILSGWMINRQYHTEYFLLIAVAASVHRLVKKEELDLREETETETDLGDAVPEQSVVDDEESSKTIVVTPVWNRLGLKDVVVCLGLTWLTFWTWDYLMANI